MILLDGTVLDTGDAGSRAAFLRERRDLVAGVRALAERVRGNPALTAKIREKYRIKNTCGYSLNALVDHEDPIEMIAHLMIGSEGTLGFISEVVFRTLPEASRRAAALMVFPDTARACEAVLKLKGLQRQRRRTDGPGGPALCGGQARHAALDSGVGRYGHGPAGGNRGQRR